MNRETAQIQIREAHWNINDPNKELSETIDKIYDDFEKQLMHKDIEIAKLQGYQTALEKEIHRLHDNDCTCTLCEEWGKNTATKSLFDVDVLY